MMNANPLYQLTDDEKREIEHLVEKKLKEFNPNSCLCRRIDKKVHEMGDHAKAYFHERFNQHSSDK